MAKNTKSDVSAIIDRMDSWIRGMEGALDNLTVISGRLENILRQLNNSYCEECGSCDSESQDVFIVKQSLSD